MLHATPTPSPDFLQSLPAQGRWILLNPDKSAGLLKYKDAETGKEVSVPSIWYNQPVQWRIDYFEFCIARIHDSIARHLKMPCPWTPHQIAESKQQIARLQRGVDHMKRTGQFPQ
jgi:hypothetical protein